MDTGHVQSACAGVHTCTRHHQTCTSNHQMCTRHHRHHQTPPDITRHHQTLPDTTRHYQTPPDITRQHQKCIRRHQTWPRHNQTCISRIRHHQRCIRYSDTTRHASDTDADFCIFSLMNIIDCLDCLDCLKWFRCQWRRWSPSQERFTTAQKPKRFFSPGRCLQEFSSP